MSIGADFKLTHYPRFCDNEGALCRAKRGVVDDAESRN
jgi:hypothetical protein